MNKQTIGKKLTVKTKAVTKKGRVINAQMTVDGQAKSRVYITTEANRDWKETRIHFGSIDELRTFKGMIEELEREFEYHKEYLSSL